MATENQIERSILEFLNSHGWFAFKVKDNTRFEDGKHRGARPFEIRGVADIIAMRNGIVWFLEVKTDKGNQSDFQKRFESKVKEYGCNYILVRSVSNVADSLKIARLVH